MAPGPQENVVEKPQLDIQYDEFYNAIDGKLCSSEEVYYGTNPLNGEKVSKAKRTHPVPLATASDLDLAVQSARKAFKTWSLTTFSHRVTLFNKFLDLYLSQASSLIPLLSAETGKPMPLATFEIHMAATTAQYFTNLTLPTETILSPLPPNFAPSKICEIETTYHPLGVAALIVPWNFPLILGFQKLAPALLTGNTVILKPSPNTPYSTLKVAEIAQQVFPPGVFNCLNLPDSLAPLISTHEGIDKIAFTGSTATGKKIQAAAAGTLKRVTLELGGNDAAIVYKDVDVTEVSETLVRGAMFNAGMMCVCTKRIYVHEAIYDEVMKEMSRVVKDLAQETKEGTDGWMGPVQNAMQWEKVRGFIDEAKKDGLKMIFRAPDKDAEHVNGGSSGANGVNGNSKKQGGFYIPPILVDNPPPNSRIIHEEPFGPIVPIMPWSDVDEVIERTNDARFGLGACVWSRNLGEARSIANRLETGSVWINSAEQPNVRAAFGGWKESGIGFETGSQGLMPYVQPRVLLVTRDKVAGEE